MTPREHYEALIAAGVEFSVRPYFVRTGATIPDDVAIEELPYDIWSADFVALWPIKGVELVSVSREMWETDPSFRRLMEDVYDQIADEEMDRLYEGRW